MCVALKRRRTSQLRKVEPVLQVRVYPVEVLGLHAQHGKLPSAIAKLLSEVGHVVVRLVRGEMRLVRRRGQGWGWGQGWDHGWGRG